MDNSKKPRIPSIHTYLPPRCDRIELDKFRRRLIRAVARMLIQEKRNEDEVWAGLKKETGCDCKELWNRIRALTIRKLGRLLEADDRVDLLSPGARMTITDWLMFDTVLVHEDLNVIGMTETTTTDKKPLEDLFNLVEQYKIEFLAGDQLAEAWSTLTMHYNNKDNRQCSPMLLQRRWYQLKLATRARFYKFWSMYKGIAKRLQAVEKYKPTNLQTEIAKQYKPLVVKPFMLWEELVKSKLVILPHEFERKGIDKQAKEDENSPDVMCLEPDVETINLDIDSDSELEYRKPSKSDQQQQVPAISIKQEPRDIDIDFAETLPYENRQEKMTQFANAVLEATAKELNEIDLQENITILDDTNNYIDIDIPPTNDSCIEKPLEEASNNENSLIEDQINTKTDEIESNADPTTLSYVDNATSLIDIDEHNIIPTVTDENGEIHQIDDDVDIDENNIEIAKEPEIVLPQITSVFGGVDVSNEALSKISMLTAQITNSKSTFIENALEPQANADTNIAPIELSSDSTDGIPIDDDRTVSQDVSNEHASVQDDAPNDGEIEMDVKPKISGNIWFGELSNDIDFADDGIQLVDDGIEYNDDECTYMGEITPDIKTESDVEDPAESSDGKPEDVPKVDKKLLMVPEVRTVKLDDMGILPIELLNHVDNKTIIDIIAFKSKPILEAIDSMSESSEENIIENVKKVKLSSNLLQKPRSRTYNPIQLCKNPDFNTRLKRLSIGFFSSSRNRGLLKACTPLTIDVSKAFESRLMNGTMYIQPTDDNDSHTNIVLTENSQNVSVVPSAMAVQSLIDNNEDDITPDECSPIVPKPVNPLEVGSQLCERSKTINLPDISEIRRINQRLLTAQVTPLQLKNNCSEVPVSIVPSPNVNENINAINTKAQGRRMPGPASRTKFLPLNVVDTSNKVTFSRTTLSTMPSIDPPAASLTKNKETIRSSEKPVPWKPKQTRLEVPWICNNTSIYSPDTLLALDTLNKMLYVLSEQDTGQIIQHSKKNKSKAKKPPPTSDLPKAQTDDHDDVQVVSETKLGGSKTKQLRKSKKKSSLYCCWAREKICQMIFFKKCVSKHNCPYPLCLCCCRDSLVEYYRREAEKAAKEDLQKTVGTQVALEPIEPIGEIPVVEPIKDIPTDVAVIIPIVQNTSEASTAGTQTTEEYKESESFVNVIADNADNADVVCNDETTVGEMMVVNSESTASDSVACNNKATLTEVNASNNESTINKVVETIDLDTSIDVAAEVSIINAALKEPDTAYVKTNMAPPPPPTKPRFRVMISNRPQAISEAKRKRLEISEGTIRVTAGNSAVGPTSPYSPITQTQTRTDRCTNLRPNYAAISYKPRRNAKQVVIDPTKSNQTPKTYVNQKMIYLNSKQISERPSDNPIFLGKNKILLTTAKFPPNFKEFEAFQRNIKQTLALPRGIQLLLQPNGRITYLRDPKAEVSDEYMATLPHIVEAIQQQIDSTVAALVSANTQPQSEVINLTDDETPDSVHNEKSSGDELNDSKAQTKTDDETPDSVNSGQTPGNGLNDSTAETRTDNEMRSGSVNNGQNPGDGLNDSTAQTKTDDETPDSVNSGQTPGNGLNDSTAETRTDNEMRSGSVNNGQTPGDGLNDSTAQTKSTSNSTLQNRVVDCPAPQETQVDKSNVAKSTDDPTNENTNIQAEQNIHTSENEKQAAQNIQITVNETQFEQNIVISDIKSVTTTVDNPIEDESTEKYISVHPETIDLSTDAEVNENISEGKSSGKTKNILSDLMAMSGIGPIDITPSQAPSSIELPPAEIPSVVSVTAPLQDGMNESAQESATNASLIPIVSSTLHHVGNPTVEVMHLRQNCCPNKSQSNTETLPQALTAITSLSELKFACSQDGLFFKLDLDTGLLVPINVCMKKFEAQSAKLRGFLNRPHRPIAPHPVETGEPKPVIDLTDDDVPQVSEVNKPTLLNASLIANQPNPHSTNILSKEDETTDNNEKEVTIRKNTNDNVKPLKLFKANRPNILKRKLKEIQERIRNAMTVQDEIRRKLKRKRESSEAGLAAVPSVNNFGQLSMDKNSSGDCSSDEEPLATVAIKMRASEKEGATSKINNITDGKVDLAVSDVNETVDKRAVDTTIDVPMENEEVSMEVGEDDITMEVEPLECLEEQPLVYDDEEEDCILGV